jgi:hypothetical protein
MITELTKKTALLFLWKINSELWTEIDSSNRRIYCDFSSEKIPFSSPSFKMSLSHFHHVFVAKIGYKISSQ